jgi:hypothetical protein
VTWLTRDDEVLAAVDDGPGGSGVRLRRHPWLVHTFGSDRGLDVAWCSERDGHLEVRATTVLRPGRLARPRPGCPVAVLAEEGALERWRLQPGHLLTLAD